MSDGNRPTSPPSREPPGEANNPRLSNIALSELERRKLLDSIDRQIAELDRRRGGQEQTAS